MGTADRLFIDQIITAWFDFAPSPSPRAFHADLLFLARSCLEKVAIKI
jgi:hypothetical protein